MQHIKKGEKGFTLITAAACAFALFGMLGLALDLGRVFIAKNEAMSYVDAAALNAARELDGFPTGGTRAVNAALGTVNSWNFSTSAFPTPVVEFSTSKNGPWAANPASWVNVGFARVTVNVNNIPLYILPVVGTSNTGAPLQ